MSAKRRFPCLRTVLDIGYLGPLVAASLMLGVALVGCLRLDWGGQAMISLPRDGLEEDEARLVSLGDASAASEKRVQINSIGMKMAWIPPGEFIMGSPPCENESDPDEIQHRVKITKPFYLSAYEVTVGQFRRFVEETGYVTGGEISPPMSIHQAGPSGRRDWSITWRKPTFLQGDDHPVLCLTWDDAVAFCEWLSRKEGHNYRLPTEAEWEYACRAGSASRFSCGDTNEDLREFANVLTPVYNENGGYADRGARRRYPYASPVGQFRPNAFGLFDMHGNAMEWCSDWYAEDYYERSPKRDPQGPAAGDQRVQRGGGFFLASRYARSANRSYCRPSLSTDVSGFRPACDDL
jgi:formylglycine-generating enzyme